jgi:hypothetical protein
LGAYTLFARSGVAIASLVAGFGALLLVSIAILWAAN